MKSISNTDTTARQQMPRRMEIREFTTTATKSGTGAHVTVPKTWLGKKIYVKVLEDEEGGEKKI